MWVWHEWWSHCPLELRRGLVRQLGKPALLAATYKGDAAAIATAAMEELESTLVDTLTQLERSSPATPGAHRLPSDIAGYGMLGCGGVL